jgi:hypothetical protein
MARRAGFRQAIAATTASTNPPPIKIARFPGFTWYKTLASKRVTTAAAAKAQQHSQRHRRLRHVELRHGRQIQRSGPNVSD